MEETWNRIVVGPDEIEGSWVAFNHPATGAYRLGKALRVDRDKVLIEFRESCKKIRKLIEKEHVYHRYNRRRLGLDRYECIEWGKEIERSRMRLTVMRKGKKAKKDE